MMSAIEQEAHIAQAAYHLHKERCPICNQSRTFTGMCPVGQELQLRSSVAVAEVADERRLKGRRHAIPTPKQQKPEYHI